MQITNPASNPTQTQNIHTIIVPDGPKNSHNKFSSFLDASIGEAKQSESAVRFDKVSTSKNIPTWVDTEYGYDADNPRKPNMRELMEALSGESLEELYRKPATQWQQISDQASEILYGVVGSSNDSRDWTKIMSSNDIVATSGEETAILHGAQVDIKTEYNDFGEVSNQYPILKDRNGHLLRSLEKTVSNLEENFKNFGITDADVAYDIEEKIIGNNFDVSVVDFLKSYKKPAPSLDNSIIATATESISTQIELGVPITEFNKL